MDGGMVYQDEDGNLIMYNHDEMGDDEDGMGDQDEYGMEGSPGVRNNLTDCVQDQEINFEENPAF